MTFVSIPQGQQALMHTWEANQNYEQKHWRGWPQHFIATSLESANIWLPLISTSLQFGASLVKNMVICWVIRSGLRQERRRGGSPCETGDGCVRKLSPYLSESRSMRKGRSSNSLSDSLDAISWVTSNMMDICNTKQIVWNSLKLIFVRPKLTIHHVGMAQTWYLHNF